ncbi:conserved hypothetical protein [Desulfitobacterium hafniense DCB-2]|uniref:Glyoxalase-like domain-containing protein n=2 Tax=root TaxID=1 RepID=B8FV15_DESHD|nr:VOC family protein [Desulfitobacterium hafniense]ACL18661.1 conserved hypothetical protein [Desulfitobacterium hafniense DCB-2]MEA5024204.1 VOC family protein [Desulfitobacterium hafniense]
MLRVSHIIYKVDHLQQAVEDFRRRGFEVEYGTKRRPYNALIYFSEGPYLELLASTGMPKPLKRLLRFFGKDAMVDRLDYWDSHGGGPCGLALETLKKDLNEERKVLERQGLGYFLMKSGRSDTKGRKLRFTGLFPDDMQIPFFMTYFNIDPKPRNFTHPNGVKRIGSIAFGTEERYIPLIRELCSDEMLHLFVGKGIKDMEFEYAPGSTPVSLD